MIKFIRNISPFNNRTEMPALILIVKKLLMFIICYWAGLLLAEGAVIGVMLACGKNFMQGEMFSDSVMNLLKYYGMIVIIGVTILCWKLIERKKLSEMGVTKHIGGWLAGALIGTVLLFVCVAAIMLTGSISFEGLSQDINTSMLLLMLGGYIIQSTAEEFLCRGLVLCSLKDRVPMPVAIAASTFVFTFNHWGNFTGSEPKYIFSGVFCLIVISCVFSFLTLKTKSIWAACGLHSVWNFCLSCILGLALSGEGASAALIDMKSVGKNLLNGGKYGIEASLVTGMVLAAASVLLWFSYKKDNKERQV